MNDEIVLFHDLTARLQSLATAQSVTDLVLAAYRDDESLAAVLAGGEVPRPEPGRPQRAGPETDVWLDAVRVEGFRGVGPRATLRLRPHPGLTLVIGRNGSGKSSFAEAAELALTDDSMRWAQRPVVFREGWRNLHHDGDPEIAVRLRLDGQPAVVLKRRWEKSATDPADAERITLVGGERQPDGYAPEWLGRVGPYRPFLSARDLERVITAKPAELYDALAPILGLDPLSRADARLQRRRKERDDRARALRASFSLLRAELDDIDDDRARRALTALGRQAARADLAALAPLSDGTDEAADHPVAVAARRLLDRDLPDLDGALSTLHEAQGRSARLTGGNSAAAARTADLLRRALDLHREEGDQPCPVCRAGRLEAGWRAGAETEVGRLEEIAAEARDAHHRVSVAHRDAVHLLQTVRRELGTTVEALATTMPEPAVRLAEALATMPALTERPDTAAADGVEATRAAWLPVVAAYSDLVEAATRWLTRRQNRWREPAASLRRWLDAAAVVRVEAEGLARLAAARTALAAATNEIRAERLAAFVGHSARIWQRLRQESNVELHEMRMEGTSTQRRVKFPVSVDGAEANALAVMSQGELHALGLAVFLPRACAQASPYRFVVVDDPVQSMDPAKVDGLAEVLGEIAGTRQVVVFTHDDRLPEAVRRLGLQATVWEVGRRERSVVELRPGDDPAERYLADARALVATKALPDDARYPVVAGFCRSALEAISVDLYRARRYAAGDSHETVEKIFAEAFTVQQRLTLALLDDPARGSELYGYLNRVYGHWATDTVKAVAAGMHGVQGSAPLPQLVRRTADLLEKLR
jgi:ABC-type lipoprotein export system ATPase subunit/energy-coupling factor transporter ATP-binding protein EcfA2